MWKMYSMYVSCPEMSAGQLFSVFSSAGKGIYSASTRFQSAIRQKKLSASILEVFYFFLGWYLPQLKGENLRVPLRTGGLAACCAARRASCWLRSKASQLPAAQQGGPADGCAARQASCRLRSKANQLPAAEQGGPADGSAARRAADGCAARRATCRLRRKASQLPATQQQGGPAAGCAARRASCRFANRWFPDFSRDARTFSPATVRV